MQAKRSRGTRNKRPHGPK
uniref:Uncharacterized protein n=1 Tax=Arundo donax TaxID=35708 RepID=A0A0A8Z1D8_ARUDO